MAPRHGWRRPAISTSLCAVHAAGGAHAAEDHRSVDVRNKTAVITGASRGLGAGLARAFAREGIRLGLCARQRPELDLPGGAPVLCEALDVRDAGALEDFAGRVAGRFGAIHLWINNAGLLEPIGPLRSASAASVAELMQVNVLGAFHGTRAFVPHRHARRRADPSASGVLVNVSSGAARNAYAGWSAYCASKAAVDRMTECVQLEEAEHGLRAHSVAPGVIDTDMQARIRRSSQADFPALPRFLEMAREGLFSSTDFVARHLLALAFEPATPLPPVLVSLPREHETG
jgi:benzil reductase ((S)-benzoin forming)